MAGKSSTSKQPNPTHGERKPQIKKQDLYMLTALWMEQSPWAREVIAKQRVVGAVFVRPNDRVLSVDCSRSNEGGLVHGAIRALIQYPDQVEGCYVYLSRQPCAHCVKMLVQAAVKKVFYLPLKPEKDEPDKPEKDEPGENKSIDALFKVSPVSREVYVPNITDADLEELKKANKKNLYGTREKPEESIESKVEWDEEWKKSLAGKIGWDEYSDDEIKKQVDEDMGIFFQWFNKGILATGENKDMTFEERKNDTSDGLSKPEEPPVTRAVPTHLSRLAQMLSNRTDDPNRGVGCVITIGKEIVATGWNGFPAKALYGNHPREGKGAKGRPDKYLRVIHAEQNALMRRHRMNLEGATAFVSKIPCNDCLPMLLDAGVKALYLSKNAFKEEENPPDSEKNFYDLLKNPEKKLTIYKQV